MTPHISSEKESIARVVIMPGDPKRVEYIAKNFLDNPVLVNDVRKETAYTGFYKGKKVTVFSSGMGIPSMGIYSYELFKFYDVKAIIRIGSAGSYVKDLNVNDLFLVDESYSTSSYRKDFIKDNKNIVFSNTHLNDLVLKTCKELNINLKSGRVHSTEAFYTEGFSIDNIVKEHNCKCVEMESFSLFTNSEHLNKMATCLLTISDSFITGASLTSEERETSFNSMIKLALETSLKID